MERFKMELESLSKNEEFARVVAAVFMSRMDPTLEEVEDVKTAAVSYTHLLPVSIAAVGQRQRQEVTMEVDRNDIKRQIREGKTALGIELGSTRIKAVLIGEDHTPVASGSHDWENQLVDGIWTYSLDAVWAGLQDAFRDLVEDVERQYDEALVTIGAIGISAMMHGYMVFDKAGDILVPFRTWRNTITGEASEKLTELFGYPVPQRWSIAHLYQAILNGEAHVPDIDYMITLEGYVHWKLTGQKVLGIGDVAGMFPVDPAAKDFDQRCVEQFDKLVEEKHFPWKLRDILPKALTAGQDAGVLTEEGAKLLDVSGNLKAGIPMCPPEGLSLIHI